MGGNIHVNEGAFIGIGTVIIPGINVGSWAQTGAGSVIIHDVTEHSIVAGVPAKKIGQNNEHN
jgi:acetyltransferase-like isoleucine patch superfamily enzyme